MSRNNIQLGANGSFTDQSRGSATGLAYNDISQISQFLLELNDAHFSTDITHINTTVTAFEISSSVTFNEGEIFFFLTDLFWRNSLLEVVLG